jgi:hypothetical protein
MGVLKALARVSMTYVAYVWLLLGFAALGTFVYALAAESSLAGILGVGLIVCFAVAVVGFRVGARRLAESNDSGIPIDGANIWAEPLRRDQIDRYLLAYRGAEQEGIRSVEPIPVDERRAA